MKWCQQNGCRTLTAFSKWSKKNSTTHGPISFKRNRETWWVFWTPVKHETHHAEASSLQFQQENPPSGYFYLEMKGSGTIIQFLPLEKGSLMGLVFLLPNAYYWENMLLIEQTVLWMPMTTKDERERGHLRQLQRCVLP